MYAYGLQWLDFVAVLHLFWPSFVCPERHSRLKEFAGRYWETNSKYRGAVCSITFSVSLSLSVWLMAIHIFASADAAYVLAFLMLVTNLHSSQVSKSLDILVNCCMQCALCYIIVYLVYFWYLCILVSFLRWSVRYSKSTTLKCGEVLMIVKIFPGSVLSKAIVRTNLANFPLGPWTIVHGINKLHWHNG